MKEFCHLGGKKSCFIIRSITNNSSNFDEKYMKI